MSPIRSRPRAGPRWIAAAVVLAGLGIGATAGAQTAPAVAVYHSLDAAGDDPRPAVPAGCTPVVPAAQGGLEIHAAAAGPKTVAVFDNPAYVDTAGFYYSESDTVQASLVSLGHTVLTFTGITAADWSAAGASADLILIPEQEVGNLASVLDAAARSAIAGYVAAGGGLVVMGGGGQNLALLNAVFGFALTADFSFTATVPLDAAVATGTPYAGGPASLDNYSATVNLPRNLLPAGALDVYHDVDSSWVFTVAVGAGQVARLGWDWFNAAPLGSEDGGWLEVLDHTLDAVASGGTPPPAFVCALQGGPGEALELWIDGGPSPGSEGENVCQLGPSGGSGDQICGAALFFQITGPGVFTDFYPDGSETATIDTVVHDPVCTAEEEGCDLAGAPVRQLRLNFVRGASSPPTGPRKIGTLVVDSSGSTEGTPTVVRAFGTAAGANLQRRGIASAGAPELIATTEAIPIPEPGGVLQLLSGLLGLGFLQRLRRWL